MSWRKQRGVHNFVWFRKVTVQLLQLSWELFFLPIWNVVVNGTVLTKLRLNENLKYPTTKLLECTSLKPFINIYCSKYLDRDCVIWENLSVLMLKQTPLCSRIMALGLFLKRTCYNYPYLIALFLAGNHLKQYEVFLKLLGFHNKWYL